jgi:hypothetical protein
VVQALDGEAKAAEDAWEGGQPGALVGGKPSERRGTGLQKGFNFNGVVS